MTHTMTIDANIEPGLTDIENPLDGSYTSLNPLIVVEGGKFSLSMGDIVITTGAGAFVGELVMFKSKSNTAVVDETDATVVEEVASPADTFVVFAAAVAVASVEVVVVITAVVFATASVEVVVVIIAGQQVSSWPFA